jgi:hypothetical protein
MAPRRQWQDAGHNRRTVYWPIRIATALTPIRTLNKHTAPRLLQSLRSYKRLRDDSPRMAERSGLQLTLATNALRAMLGLFFIARAGEEAVGVIRSSWNDPYRRSPAHRASSTRFPCGGCGRRKGSRPSCCPSPEHVLKLSDVLFSAGLRRRSAWAAKSLRGLRILPAQRGPAWSSGGRARSHGTGSSQQGSSGILTVGWSPTLQTAGGRGCEVKNHAP